MAYSTQSFILCRSTVEKFFNLEEHFADLEDVIHSKNLVFYEESEATSRADSL